MAGATSSRLDFPSRTDRRRFWGVTVIDWRTGPEGMDGFLSRLGYADLPATDTSDPGVVDPSAIQDLLARGEQVAAYLSAVWDLHLPAAQAVLPYSLIGDWRLPEETRIWRSRYRSEN
jgi:hypothetical protein